MDASQIVRTDSAELNLLFLINTYNAIAGTAKALHPGQVTYSAPTPRTPDANINNTTMTLTPVIGQGFKGAPVDITYNRPRISHCVSAPVLDVEVANNNAGYLNTFLTIVATQLGVILAEIELDASTPLSSVANDGVAVPLIINAISGSKLYTGTVTMQVTWPVEQFDLGATLVTRDMTGYTEK